MVTQTASVTFTLEELWLPRAFVRHEIAQQDSWAYPPANLDLNDQIAEAILLCDEHQLAEAAFAADPGRLPRDRCRCPSGCESANGTRLGQSVLLKTFAARRDIAGGPAAQAQERALLDEALRERIDRALGDNRRSGDDG